MIKNHVWFQKSFVEQCIKLLNLILLFYLLIWNASEVSNSPACCERCPFERWNRLSIIIELEFNSPSINYFHLNQTTFLLFLFIKSWGTLKDSGLEIVFSLRLFGVGAKSWTQVFKCFLFRWLVQDSYKYLRLGCSSLAYIVFRKVFWTADSKGFRVYHSMSHSRFSNS